MKLSLFRKNAFEHKVSFLLKNGVKSLSEVRKNFYPHQLRTRTRTREPHPHPHHTRTISQNRTLFSKPHPHPHQQNRTDALTFALTIIYKFDIELHYVCIKVM